MKILVLGDIHGRKIWKDIVNQENPDLTIFLGDYVDTHSLETVQEQFENFLEILDYKEKNPEKIILLRGNHCYRYGFPIGEESSGYSLWMFNNFPRERYVKNTQWIYILDHIIFSHAGVSKKWMKWISLHDINKINDLNYHDFMFNGGSFDMYGTDPQQSPVWIRPETLVDHAIEGYDQVVGHTPVRDIHAITMQNKAKNKLWLCDCLGFRQYLIIENGEFIPRKI